MEKKLYGEFHRGKSNESIIRLHNLRVLHYKENTLRGTNRIIYLLLFREIELKKKKESPGKRNIARNVTVCMMNLMNRRQSPCAEWYRRRKRYFRIGKHAHLWRIKMVLKKYRWIYHGWEFIRLPRWNTNGNQFVKT